MIYLFFFYDNFTLQYIKTFYDMILSIIYNKYFDIFLNDLILIKYTYNYNCQQNHCIRLLV